jgi:hypothetical protein
MRAKREQDKGGKTAQNKAIRGTLASGRRIERGREKRDEETEEIDANEEAIKFIFFGVLTETRQIVTSLLRHCI